MKNVPRATQILCHLFRVSFSRSDDLWFLLLKLKMDDENKNVKISITFHARRGKNAENLIFNFSLLLFLKLMLWCVCFLQIADAVEFRGIFRNICLSHIDSVYWEQLMIWCVHFTIDFNLCESEVGWQDVGWWKGKMYVLKLKLDEKFIFY